MAGSLEAITTQDYWRALAPSFHIADPGFLSPNAADASAVDLMTGQAVDIQALSAAGNIDHQARVMLMSVNSRAAPYVSGRIIRARVQRRRAEGQVVQIAVKALCRSGLWRKSVGISIRRGAGVGRARTVQLRGERLQRRTQNLGREQQARGIRLRADSGKNFHGERPGFRPLVAISWMWRVPRPAEL